MDNSEEIKAIRAQLGWTQKQMAEAMGLVTSYVNSLENGKKPVLPRVLMKARWVLEREDERKLNSTAHGQLRLRIKAYLEKVLDSCGDDRDRLSWILVELQRQFPVVDPAKDNTKELEVAAAKSADDLAEKFREKQSSLPNPGVVKPALPPGPRSK